VRYLRSARRNRDACGYPLLEVFKFSLLSWRRHPYAKFLVSRMRDLLSLKAGSRMELDLKELAVLRDAPATVDSFVLLLGPRVLVVHAFEPRMLKPCAVRVNAVCVPGVGIAERVPDGVLQKAECLAHGVTTFVDGLGDLLGEPVSTLKAV